MNFYKHFMGDYGKKTAHLSLIEHGAYRVLLDAYYATGRPLPAPHAELYRIAKAFSPAERRAVDKVADEFFPIGPDGLRHNERADEEIQKHAEQSEANRAVAVERERQRKEHDTSTNRDTKLEPNHSHSQKKKKQGAYAPPDWVPLEAWNAYVEMRVSLRKPMTTYAKDLAVKTLDRLRREGCEPEAVLHNSVQNSYLGLFAVGKRQGGGGLAL